MKGDVDVELSMSNIGSRERGDQVKPLKHSAEKRMIPKKHPAWCHPDFYSPILCYIVYSRKPKEKCIKRNMQSIFSFNERFTKEMARSQK